MRCQLWCPRRNPDCLRGITNRSVTASKGPDATLKAHPRAQPDKNLDHVRLETEAFPEQAGAERVVSIETVWFLDRAPSDAIIETTSAGCSWDVFIFIKFLNCGWKNVVNCHLVMYVTVVCMLGAFLFMFFLVLSSQFSRHDSLILLTIPWLKTHWLSRHW